MRKESNMSTPILMHAEDKNKGKYLHTMQSGITINDKPCVVVYYHPIFENKNIQLGERLTATTIEESIGDPLFGMGFYHEESIDSVIEALTIARRMLIEQKARWAAI